MGDIAFLACRRGPAGWPASPAPGRSAEIFSGSDLGARAGPDGRDRPAPGRAAGCRPWCGRRPPSRRRATSSRSAAACSTKAPEIGRFDQVASAVTWNSTIMPAPRWSAVTSGVPSARLAQVLSARSTDGSARIWRFTVTSPGTSIPASGLSAGIGAIFCGSDHDIVPPSWRSPVRSRTGTSGSSPGAAARRGPAKRTR